jgi:hypothetical protein
MGYANGLDARPRPSFPRQPARAVPRAGCHRWFPAQVLFLTFFTNTVLLACFLGMSIGCLAAARPRQYIAWTPALLAIALGAARGIEWWRERSGAAFGVGNVASPQLVFFGTESRSGDPSQFVLPIELVAGVLFVLVALVMLGPGQQLGARSRGSRAGSRRTR